MIEAEKLKEYDKSKFRPGYASIKRNGIHGIYDPKLKMIYSRTPREIVGLEHLLKELQSFPFPVVGELEIPGLVFEEMSGKIRSHNKTPEATFSIFNSIIPNTDFEIRYSLVWRHINDNLPNSKFIKLEPVTRVVSPQQYDSFHNMIINHGHEGTCWIAPNHIYQPGKRTWNWMKRIEPKFIEALVIDILPGTKGKKYENSMGYMLCEFFTGAEVKKVKVGIFKGQTDEWRQNIYDNRDEYIDETITIEFKDYSKNGIPVQPRFKAFRWDL